MPLFWHGQPEASSLFSASIDPGDFRRVASVATGALVEFDVALCFHWRQHSEEDSARYPGKDRQDSIYKCCLYKCVVLCQTRLYLTVFALEVNAPLV